jgi:hypothetical protein
LIGTDGAKTIGVLVKPDLAEKTTQEAVIELVKGKLGFLKLGYFIVKNRSADDNESIIAACIAKDLFFFHGFCLSERSRSMWS